MFEETPRKFDFVDKVKLRVGDLRVGMYVCELDRPWLNTPFQLQGFEIRHDDEIEQLRRLCEYVYIDVLRTRVVHMTIEAIPPHSFLNERRLVSFEKEILAAEATHKNASICIRGLINEVRFGKSVDIALAKAAVSDCVASIIRNPDAIMFLTRMRSKDEYTSQHAFDVCIYSIIMGRFAGLQGRDLEELGTCGLLHDLGKLEIPEEILGKEGRLNRDEFAIIRQHTTKGRDILLAGRNLFSGTVDVAYGHHENLDGTGYPRGLEGHQLGQYCKIVAIADKYDAITSERPYRMAHDHLEAVGILNRMAKEKQIDADFTGGFVAYMGIYPPGSIVQLTSGEVGIVLETNPQQRLRPQLLVVRGADGSTLERFVDLAEKLKDEQGNPLKIKSVCRPEDYAIDVRQYRSVILNSFG